MRQLAANSRFLLKSIMQLFSNHKYKKLYPAIFIIGLIAFSIPLLAYAHNGSFMRIQGDDYCYLAVQSQHGFWGTQWYSYQSVSDLYNGNRFSLNFAVALLGQFGSSLPSIAPALALIVWFSAWFLALDQASKFWSRNFKWFEVSLIIAIIIFFTLYIVSDITQILYWYVGMATYTLPLILNGFVLGLVFLSSRKTASLWLIPLIFVSFLSGGFSETTGFVQVAYLAVFCLGVFYFDRRVQNPFVKKLYLPSMLALLASLLALLALALAPSTAPRLATSSHPSFLGIVINSLNYGLTFIVGTFLSTPLPIFVLLFLAFLLAIIMRSKLARMLTISPRSFIILLLIVISVWYLLCVISMSPSVYAQNAYPGERALLPARFISVISLFSVGWLIGYAVPLPAKLTNHHVLYSFGTLVLLGMLFVYPLRTIPKITSNISFYSKWSAAWDTRDQLIREAKADGQKDIEVMNIDHPIKDIGELSPDPSYWYNVCAAQYYNVNSITADLPGWDR